MNIPRKDTTLDFGFVQIPVSVYPAVEDDELDLKTLCHGKPPKMAIRCAEGGEEYTSWNKIPERGYEWAKGQYIVLSPEEIAAAKEARPKVDTIKVDKSVDFQKTGTRYVYTNAMRVLPQEKSPESARGNYRAVYEVVKESGRAILARFSPSTKVRHYAIFNLEHKGEKDADGKAVPRECKHTRQAEHLMRTRGETAYRLIRPLGPWFEELQEYIARLVDFSRNEKLRTDGFAAFRADLERFRSEREKVSEALDATDTMIELYVDLLKQISEGL